MQPGVEIDQGIVKPPDDLKFTSVSFFAEAAITEMFSDDTKNDKTKPKRITSKSHKTMATISEQKEQNETSLTDQTKLLTTKTKECLTDSLQTKEQLPNELKGRECLADNLETGENLTDELKTKPGLTDNPGTSASLTSELKTKECLTENLVTSKNLTDELKTGANLSNELKIKENLPNEVESEFKKGNMRKSSNINKNTPESNKISINILSQIKTNVKQWLTLETFIYLHGEEKIKDHLDETKLSNYFESLKVDELQTSQQMKYVNICRRLRLQELADEKFDSSVTGKSVKAVPDYKKLREEGKMLDLKVKSFYGGILYEQEDSNFPSKKKDLKSDEEEGEEETVLPLVESKAQNALRKKIFLQSVNRV